MTVEQIESELAELEKRYQEDRADLERALAYARRNSAPKAPVLLPIPKSEWAPLRGKISPIRGGIKTDRQIIREFLAGWTGTFTIKQLMDAAQRHPDSPAAKFDKNLWAATLFWLCQNRFIEVVEPRRGNIAGTYRIIVSRNDLVTPTRRKNSDQSPLQDAVLEAIKRIDKTRFSKNDIVNVVQKDEPERSPDVIGAVLHRLAANNIGARIFAKSHQGNIYEKL